MLVAWETGSLPRVSLSTLQASRGAGWLCPNPRVLLPVPQGLVTSCAPGPFTKCTQALQVASLSEARKGRGRRYPLFPNQLSQLISPASYQKPRGS